MLLHVRQKQTDAATTTECFCSMPSLQQGMIDLEFAVAILES